MAWLKSTPPGTELIEDPALDDPELEDPKDDPELEDPNEDPELEGPNEELDELEGLDAKDDPELKDPVPKDDPELEDPKDVPKLEDELDEGLDPNEDPEKLDDPDPKDDPDPDPMECSEKETRLKCFNWALSNALQNALIGPFPRPCSCLSSSAQVRLISNSISRVAEKRLSSLTSPTLSGDCLSVYSWMNASRISSGVNSRDCSSAMS